MFNTERTHIGYDGVVPLSATIVNRRHISILSEFMRYCARCAIQIICLNYDTDKEIYDIHLCRHVKKHTRKQTLFQPIRYKQHSRSRMAHAITGNTSICVTRKDK